MIKEVACGKLYIAGEYAVLIDDQPAILVGVNRLVEVSLNDSLFGMIIDSFGNIYNFDFINLKLFEKNQNNSLLYNTLFWLHKILKFYNLNLKNFKIVIANQLFEDNIKIGLGSSGALMVALTKAILKYHNFVFDELFLYKIVVLIQHFSKMKGSYGDVACCCFGGCIYYQKPASQFLDKLEFNDLNKHWPLLKIEKIKIDPLFNMIVFWSKEIAVTDNFVTKFLNADLDNDFLFNSKKNTELLKSSLELGNYDDLKLAFSNLDQNLRDLDSKLQLHMFIPTFSEIINKSNYPIKSSGAGGGDCLVGFVLDSDKEAIKNNQYYLNVEVFNYYES